LSLGIGIGLGACGEDTTGNHENPATQIIAADLAGSVLGALGQTGVVVAAIEGIGHDGHRAEWHVQSPSGKEWLLSAGRHGIDGSRVEATSYGNVADGEYARMEFIFDGGDMIQDGIALTDVEWTLMGVDGHNIVSVTAVGRTENIGGSEGCHDSPDVLRYQLIADSGGVKYRIPSLGQGGSAMDDTSTALEAARAIQNILVG
jgi:hypothetical protein